jgi:hypothetical protein
VVSLGESLARIDDLPIEVLNGHLVARHDAAAVAHLFRVSAGMESLALGEGQILGQVRDAYKLVSDTGTVWKSTPAHEPILWRHVLGGRQSPDREAKEQSPWGWLFYRRVKTGKTFYRPMNRVVNAHLKGIMPDDPSPDAPVFLGGGTRPNARFEAICGLAGIKPRLDIESGKEEPWELKDLRKTCATYYDEHVPESSVEILGHSVGGITYRHYAHRSPLAFRAITTLPQPTAFSALLKGNGGECPCCRRRFADAS